MADFEKFNYKTLSSLKEKIKQLDLEIKLADDISPLFKKVKINGFELPNSLAIHPMEGCDGTEDGKPSELTVRRYRRFAKGGAGLLWFEATAVVPEGRANPRQLCINRDNLGSFKELVQIALKDAKESMGEDHRPMCILQLTHSGRYSKPNGKPQPIIAFHDPNLDTRAGVKAEQEPISDVELDKLQEKYVEAALLAQEAGFDGVDIKACHRYLISELLAGHTRKGKYGGSFANRTRFLLETIEKVKAKVKPEFIVTLRLNTFDGHPYPYGWGVDKENFMKPDLSEPKQLLKLLSDKGVSMVSTSAGNPYYTKPQIGRPFDQPVLGADVPEEHPLESAARLLNITKELQTTIPELAVVGVGYSWLRQFFGHAGAANIADNAVTIVGVGREAFAYPDFAKDLIVTGKMDERKLCIACSKCTQIMRDGGKTGCVIRDAKVYVPIYKEGRR